MDHRTIAQRGACDEPPARPRPRPATVPYRRPAIRPTAAAHDRPARHSSLRLNVTPPRPSHGSTTPPVTTVFFTLEFKAGCYETLDGTRTGRLTRRDALVVQLE